MPSLALSPRQLLTFLAHLFKAVARQHHRDLVPLLSRHIGTDAVVIDVGAHAGQFAKLFALLAPRGRIYAFEPGAYARAILERVVRWRRLANITVVPLGLSDGPGAAELSMPIKASGSLGFGLAHIGASERNARIERIALVTLDDFAATEGLQRIDFIKADVEGWEIRMLRGALRSLDRFRPVLMLELVAAHLARADTEADEAWRLLGALGYRGYRLGPAEPEEAPRFQGDADYLFVAY